MISCSHPGRVKKLHVCDAGQGAATPLARIVRVGCALALALTLANCAGSQVTHRKSGRDNKYGVAPSPKVIPDGEPIPKGGGRAMVGKPYVLGERTYVPVQGRGYLREGYASWYGTAFHGRLTANGEVFDKESIAAAHPTLPLPSYVRVTNVANSRSMIVRVNDRGPYEKNRLIDVSERVAEALEFHRKGTTQVRVEYVGKASLAGSDDAKLLASLREDGVPAPVGRSRSNVMLADLGREAQPVAPVPVTRGAERMPRVAAEPTKVARAEVSTGEEAEGPEIEAEFPATAPPASATARARVTMADAEDAGPLPPRRPASTDPDPPPVAVRDARIAASPPAAGPPVGFLPPQRPALAGIY